MEYLEDNPIINRICNKFKKYYHNRNREYSYLFARQCYENSKDDKFIMEQFGDTLNQNDIYLQTKAFGDNFPYPLSIYNEPIESQ